MKCFGILPMAGKGSRLQPIAFSKELYPVAYKRKHFAISEFSIRAMMKAKVDEIKLVIRPEKIDIANFYARNDYPVSIYFHSKPPYSLPESSLLPITAMNDDDICLFGLPDTLFYPNNGFLKIREQLENGADLCLGLFKVKDASKFDSVATNHEGDVLGVLVKQNPPLSSNIWGIWGGKVKALKELRSTIDRQKDKKEKLLGIGFNSLACKGELNFKAVNIGDQYFDIGTMDSIVRVNNIIEKFEF